jgi:CubicO group peptidase (beta-lactamase class C family)
VPDFSGAARLIDEAAAARAFPAASIEVGTGNRPIWQHAAGRLTYDDDAPATTPDTIFDLASLTKVIATTTLVMRLVGRRRLLLDTPIRQLVPAWTGADRAHVTVLDLLEHSAGLAAWWPLYKHGQTLVEFEHLIAELPLEYGPRTRSIYSDLGFILLGGIVAERGDAPLDAQCDALIGDTGLVFRRFAPRWRRRNSTRSGGADCSSARCTTRTPGPWAVSPDMPASSAARPRWDVSRDWCCGRFDRRAGWQCRGCGRASSDDHAYREARGRWDGTRWCPPRHAAR